MTISPARSVMKYAAMPLLLAAVCAAAYGQGDICRIIPEVPAVILGYVAAAGDIRHRLVSNRLIAALAVSWAAAIVLCGFLFPQQILNEALSGIAGAAVAGCLFFSAYVLSRGKLGGGDVKFMTVMGLPLSVWHVLPAAFLGCVFAAFYCLARIVRKKADLQTEIPMVPFLYAGVILAFLLGM